MYDLLIIGGGINGTGIARDAAGRGLNVLLCEKDDLASHTSSSSTKLIHGGLRYLEHYDFSLVRKALIEREVLLEAAPHIIWPMRFVLPHHKSLRPAWLIRLGLFLYDHLGGRKILPPTRVLRRNRSTVFDPLKDDFSLAFEYSDCWVDDARLVVLNAVDARERGATIMTRTRCAGLKRQSGHWSATLNVEGQADMTVTAKTVVNAAGPWVEDIIDQAFDTKSNIGVRLVKGSHIITRRLFEGEHAYFFQNGDGRIMFAIPYENGEFTLVGTTDLPYDADKDEVKISPEEIDYLCEAASEYFAEPVTPDDVVATYSGVRPLYDDQSDDASTVTRDYVLAYDNQNKTAAPIVSVFGGKITTYRKLAENTLSLFGSDLPMMGEPWTKTAHLPGGDLPSVDFDGYAALEATRYEWLPEQHLHRLLRAYGTRTARILGDATSPNELGFHYGGGLYQNEVDYLVEFEFARSADDILLRRTKTGLHLEPEQAAMLDAWFKRRAAA